jgi:fructose-bisphosphate aldolase class II
MSEFKLKPGVVTGAGYKTLVQAAKAGGYALPAVNVVGSNGMNAVMEAAAKAKSDIIIQLSNTGAAFYAGAGMPDGFRAKVLGAVAAAQHAHLLAEHYGICVVMHTDHANRELIPWVEALLDEGEKHFAQHGKPLYSSHMLDLSADPIDFNLAECARILERMAKLEMSLEIELGVTGGEEDGMGKEFKEGADNSRLYTQPEDVLRAYDLLNPIGHFSVAASFGNVHGVYKPGNVKLRPEILKNSQDLVQKTHRTGHNPLHLVFHGGSARERKSPPFPVLLEPTRSSLSPSRSAPMSTATRARSASRSIRTTARPTRRPTTRANTCAPASRASSSACRKRARTWLEGRSIARLAEASRLRVTHPGGWSKLPFSVWEGGAAPGETPALA